MKRLKLLLIAIMVGNFQWCFAQLQIVTIAPNKYETTKPITLTAYNPSAIVPYNKYYWDFGDGEVLETTNFLISHAYKKSGVFRVTLVAETTTGTYDRITTSLNLFETVGINFNTVPNSLSPCGLDVEFFDKSYSALDWWWDFDNDNVTDSRVRDPVHSYTAPGIYSVSLTIKTTLGVIVKKTFDNVIVHDCVGSSQFRQILPPSLYQCSNTPYISAIGSVTGGTPGVTQYMPANAPNPSKAYQYRNYVWTARDANGVLIPMFEEEFMPETYLDLSDSRIQNGFSTSGEYTVYIQLNVSDNSFPVTVNSHIISYFPITLYKPMVTATADINLCPGYDDQLVGSWPMYSSQGGHSLLTSFKLKDQNGVIIPGYSGLGTNPVMKVPDNSNETYTVEVTVQDRAGCTNTRTTTINANDVEVGIGNDFRVCLNEDNRKMDPSVSGGTGLFTSYNWSPATWLDDHQKRDPTILATTNNVSNTYTLVVTDSKGCTGTDQVTVTSNQTFPSITLPADKEYCMIKFDAGGPTEWSVSPANPVFYFYDDGNEDLPAVEPVATSSTGNKEITWRLNGILKHVGDQFIPKNLDLSSQNYFHSTQTYTARITEDVSGCYAEDVITISAKQKPHFGMKDVLDPNVGGLCQELYLCATGTNPTWMPTYDLTHIHGHNHGLTQASYIIANRQWLEQIDVDETDPSSTKVVPEILNANQTLPTVKLERSLALTQSITLTSGCSAVSSNGVSIVVSKGVPDADFTVDPCIRGLNEIYFTNNTDYKTSTAWMQCEGASTPSNFGVVWNYGSTGLPTSSSNSFSVPGFEANPGTDNPFEMPRTHVAGFSNQGSKTITMQATNTCGTSSVTKTYSIIPNAPTVSPLLQICHPSFNQSSEQAAMVIRLSESCTSTNILANDKGHFVAADIITVREGFQAHVGSDVWLRIDECMIPPPLPAPRSNDVDQDRDVSEDIVKNEELNVIEVDAIPEIDQAQNEVAGFDVFPNPSSGYVEVRVQGDVSENDVIYVVNIYGSTVMEVALSSQVQLDLGTVSKGLYFVVLMNGTSTRGIKKVVIQ